MAVSHGLRRCAIGEAHSNRCKSHCDGGCGAVLGGSAFKELPSHILRIDTPPQTYYPKPPWRHHYNAIGNSLNALPPSKAPQTCYPNSNPPWRNHYNAIWSLWTHFPPNEPAPDQREHSASLAAPTRLTPPIFAPTHSRFYCKTQHFERNLTFCHILGVVKHTTSAAYCVVTPPIDITSLWFHFLIDITSSLTSLALWLH